MQLRHVICASVLLVSSATAQDFVTPFAPPFESTTPYFEQSAPLLEFPAPSFGPVAAPPAPPGADRYSPAVFSPAPDSPTFESTWYGRIDYFQWHESIGGRNFVTETGPLATLGYLRQVGQHRFRGEFFDGQVNYSGFAQFPDGRLDPLSSATNYIGLRGEYDLLYDPKSWPSATLLCGVGTRFWYRDLPDARSASGAPVRGYLETWWTSYPYIGVQTRRELTDGSVEFYTAGRAGFTAVTFEHVTWNDAVLHPKVGFTGQLEAGFRGSQFFVSAFTEAMSWGQSDVERQLLQPASTLLTIGLRAGVTF